MHRDLNDEDDLDRVQRVARLARLDLSPERAQELAPQFARILRNFQTLAELPSPPAKGPGHQSPPSQAWRDDQPQPSLERDELLQAAPEPHEGHYGVPKTLRSEG